MKIITWRVIVSLVIILLVFIFLKKITKVKIMGNESIELSFLSIFTLITFFIFLIVSKYSYKFKRGILLDEDFSKPQAFHHSAISRSGGIAGIISLIYFLIIYYLIYSKFLLDYFFISNLMFLLVF